MASNRLGRAVGDLSLRVKQGFGKRHRLCRSKDFQEIFKRGNIFRRSFCRVYAYPNARVGSRLAVVISKKTISLSTRRHQLKRVVRESFRLNPERLVGFDVIVIINKGLFSKEALWLTLDSIWQDIHRWRGAL